mmetsp:Transcript_19041/g.16876  ORF Transcript_19041/g.16876 Transcript_19041/m.16876 type:complete len:160 (+) Transcript_19041:285-764(+)
MRRALRKFTVTIYLKAKKNMEIINHFRKFRRFPAHRTWSDRSLGKGDGNKDDRNKRSIRKKMKDYGFHDKKYFRFNEDTKYQKDLYTAEKKFMGSGFKRSASEKTLKEYKIIDFRNSFLNLPGAKDLLKEIKVIEEIEKRPKGNKLTEEYEYKNLQKIS